MLSGRLIIFKIILTIVGVFIALSLFYPVLYIIAQRFM